MTKERLKYKQAIEEIEDILNKLENDELDIDDLGVNVKRAALLINQCVEKLKKTEDEVENILKDLNSGDKTEF